MDSQSILVVDDSPIIVRKLTTMLEKLGHRVVQTATTGQEAIAAYKAIKPDVVTMDIIMPDMDGIEATKHILAENPDAIIIMITSIGQESMVSDAIIAGAKGYVLKPFQEDRVNAVISKACKKIIHHHR
jgi:two-component system, chemotaxis family, chemotaxis protein CheY